jgi:hypothetical protein
MARALAALAIVLGLATASRGHAGDIYQWTDEQGRVHYSNHGGTSPGDSSAPSEPADQGWESVLEKRQGREDFQEKAEAAINSLELQMIRKKRDRGQAQEALEATQANIVRAQASTAADLPMLKAREATQITNLRKLDAEIGAIEMGIAKIRALKAAEKEQRSSR